MTPHDDKIDELDEEIRSARQQAEDNGTITDQDHPPRYVDSGDEGKEEDDQTASPM